MQRAAGSGSGNRLGPVLEELPDLGYTDSWTGEAAGYDGFTLPALAAVCAPGLRLGTGVVPDPRA
ncbi:MULTISPECIES: hypothetical protein [unclassified Streptomyces]|uniref:hypothetical protein n=1 Tax=unclassified Streptomyces TaxID=2593676 RepID=UPI002E2B08C7|nr:hypothetical protein [Streptomyces sp. NBC_00228]